MIKKLILVRAGITAWDEQDRIQGIVPLPLSDSGKQMLQNIAQIIRSHGPDILYSSGNESSGVTAQFLAQQCHLKTRTIPELKELDCGLWQGLRIKDARERYGKTFRQWEQSPTTICPPEGESVQQVEQRIREILPKLHKKQKGKTVVLVAARIISGLIDCVLSDSTLEDMWRSVHRSEPIRLYEFHGHDCQAIRPAGSSIEELKTPSVLHATLAR